MKKQELTNIELIEEDGQYYLSVEYLIEDKSKIEKMTIPRVQLPFAKSYIPPMTDRVFEPGLCLSLRPTHPAWADYQSVIR